MRKIIKIEKQEATNVRRKRVAAYARVSSGKEAMLQSLSAQISYYNDYISHRGDWELVSIYADEALTGTKETRPEFQRMLTDCKNGKIDMVITKSLTRFARNTVTLLKTVRELKELGIDVYFEKENIHTLSSDGELMLTLLAMYAQEESSSASENQKWRIRKMFEEGRPTTGTMLGYRLKNGMLTVVPEEADLVKQIFASYLSGMGINKIMKRLNLIGAVTRHGGVWRESTVRGILHNEKYTGDMLLQKTYRLDYISKKKTINRGEKPMYYVENSHEPIIDKETFRRVQEEFKRRADKIRALPRSDTPYIFTGIIRCGLCGRNYRRRIANASSKYAKPAWICLTYNQNGRDACPSQQIPERILIQKTSEVLGVAKLDRKTLLEHITQIKVPRHNLLIYVFRDGCTKEVVWQNPSRKESWTPEMKQKAREDQKKRRKEKE